MRDDELQYDQTAELEPADDERSEPEDPEDIQLDSDAFVKWKEVTQRIPVAKMTEVQTTTFEAVTGKLPDLSMTRTSPIPPVSTGQETKVVESPEPADPTPEPQAQEETEIQEEQYKPLTPDEFFE